MIRLLSAFVLVSAFAGAACGNAAGEDDDPPVDAQVPDAQPIAPDAQAAPDAGPPPDASPPCIDGDAQRQDPDTGACYMLFTTNSVSWVDARDACTSVGPGTRMVTLTTLAEHDLLVDMSTGFNVWLGATDAAEEGEFLWVTGEPVTFAVWDEGEPNNDSNGVPEHCAMLINSGTRAGTWDDRRCELLNAYACKRL